MCYQYFLFFLVFLCLSAKQSSTAGTQHQSKESPSTSPSLNHTITTLLDTNMSDVQLRTPPQSGEHSPATLTTQQPKSTTQLASTTTITNQKLEGAAFQGAGSTTSSQHRVDLESSKSTTKQHSTAGRSQSKMALVICSSWLCSKTMASLMMNKSLA